MIRPQRWLIDVRFKAPSRWIFRRINKIEFSDATGCSLATNRGSHCGQQFREFLPGRHRTYHRTECLPLPCLFLAYTVHQQPATLYMRAQTQATRKLMGERRIGSKQQI